MWKSIYDFLVSNKLLNSNLFIAATTLVVGLSALYIYQKRKKDKLKDAATVILTEIKRASELIPVIKDKLTKSGYLEDDIERIRIGGWNTYKFDFVTFLSTEEWRAIDNFYRDCLEYDEAVELNTSYFGEDVKHIYESLHLNYLDEVTKFLGTKTSTPKKISASLSKKLNDFRDFYISNLFPHISYRPQKPFNDALKAANAINPDLLLTTVGTSLTAIAQPMPWYKRLMNKRG